MPLLQIEAFNAGVLGEKVIETEQNLISDKDVERGSSSLGRALNEPNLHLDSKLENPTSFVFSAQRSMDLTHKKNCGSQNQPGGSWAKIKTASSS